VLDQNGEGSDSTVIAAIETAIILKPVYNVRVINLSVGRPVYESYKLDPLCQAVEAAWKAGIVVVTAAGNDGRDNSFGTQGYGTISAPGNDPYVITVGAMKTMGTYTRTDDLIATYSSKGPTQVDHIVKPEEVEPGTLFVSLMVPGATLETAYPGNDVQLSYYESGLTAAQGQTTSTHYFILLHRVPAQLNCNRSQILFRHSKRRLVIVEHEGPVRRLRAPSPRQMVVIR
jgi:serine protease AprX